MPLYDKEIEALITAAKDSVHAAQAWAVVRTPQKNEQNHKALLEALANEEKAKQDLIDYIEANYERKLR